MIFSTWLMVEVPGNRAFPSSISPRMQPRLHISTPLVYLWTRLQHKRLKRNVSLICNAPPFRESRPAVVKISYKNIVKLKIKLFVPFKGKPRVLFRDIRDQSERTKCIPFLPSHNFVLKNSQKYINVSNVLYAYFHSKCEYCPDCLTPQFLRFFFG